MPGVWENDTPALNCFTFSGRAENIGQKKIIRLYEMSFFRYNATRSVLRYGSGSRVRLGFSRLFVPSLHCRRWFYWTELMMSCLMLQQGPCDQP